MRRILLVMAVAALMVAFMAAPAFADASGVPNENACHGQQNKKDNQLGGTPAEIAKDNPAIFSNAGDVEKFIKTFC